MITYAAWIAVVFIAGCLDPGFWFVVPAAITISFLKRGWYANNGVGPGRAVVIGFIFALPPSIGIYFLGSWVSTLT